MSTPYYQSKRDAIRALVAAYGDAPESYATIIRGFVVLVDLGLVDRADMTDAEATARTMLYHRRKGRWPETAAA